MYGRNEIEEFLKLSCTTGKSSGNHQGRNEDQADSLLRVLQPPLFLSVIALFMY
jgi:hypothetical protein